MDQQPTTTVPATVAGGLPFAECPRWHEGALWFSDFTSQVLRASPGSAVEVVCDVPAAPAGLGFDPQGRLLIASMGDRRVLRLDDGTLVEHADLSAIVPAGLNDMMVTADGGAYVGNLGADVPPGEECLPAPLVYVDPAGRPRVVADGLCGPNGMALADGGWTLLVAETLAARITAFAIRPDGALADRRVWAQLGPEPEARDLFTAMRTGPLPDGIAIDREGALWVGNAGGPAFRVAQGGEVLDRIDVAGLCVYAVAFGGEGLRTLFLCVAPPLTTYWPELEAQLNDPQRQGRRGRRAQVLACQVPVAGAPRAAGGEPSGPQDTD
ncbi:MAG: SMP-30/gluconolactonase/LRE family protein [Actinobacteria bacterium]|nr:SMP-30/gluconolactonase/LRE family protein [Actinomycetota bacterium]